MNKIVFYCLAFFFFFYHLTIYICCCVLYICIHTHINIWCYKPPCYSVTYICKSVRQFWSWLDSLIYMHSAVRLKRALSILAGFSHFTVMFVCWSRMVSLLGQLGNFSHGLSSSSRLARNYSFGDGKVPWDRVEICKLSWCLGLELAYHHFNLIHWARETAPGQPRFKNKIHSKMGNILLIMRDTSKSYCKG